MYEFLSETITQEEFNKAVAEYNPSKKKVNQTTGFVQPVNPSKMCVYDFPGTWARCKYCGKISKYMQWKECPAYEKKEQENKWETAGSTVAEN